MGRLLRDWSVIFSPINLERSGKNLSHGRATAATFTGGLAALIAARHAMTMRAFWCIRNRDRWRILRRSTLSVWTRSIIGARSCSHRIST